MKSRRNLFEFITLMKEIRRGGREHRALLQLGAPALLEELATVHLGGWIGEAVRTATGSTTDLSGARDLTTTFQRATVAASLLDGTTAAGRAAAEIRSRLGWALANVRHPDPVVRSYAPRDLAWAVRAARRARNLTK